MKRNQKNVITRRNLTQGKQLTKHAQKLITAFMKTYVDDWILNEYACPGDEPRCESIAITDKLVTTKEEVKTKCMYIRHTWVYTHDCDCEVRHREMNENHKLLNHLRPQL